MNIDFDTSGEPLKTVPERLSGMISTFVTPRKALEYLALFAMLSVIYYCYFVQGAKANACPPDAELTLSEIGLSALKLFLFTGWPFALLAACDPAWRSKDAGNVFLAAYITTNVFWYHKTGCGFCIFAASFRIIPYVFCALVAHSLGAWRFRLRGDE
jgi:hypothetical protein